MSESGERTLTARIGRFLDRYPIATTSGAGECYSAYLEAFVLLANARAAILEAERQLTVAPPGPPEEA